MKSWSLDCVLTIEAETANDAFNRLMDLVTENEIALTVNVIEDEDGNKALPPTGDSAP